MFLESLIRRNPDFIGAAIDLHQQGLIPASSYVLDLDQIAQNARAFASAANPLGLKTFPMTKQMGRNPEFLRTLSGAGFERFVAVDMNGARRIHSEGYGIGHLGHLVQVPFAEARSAAAMEPSFWTVYSYERARQASEAAQAADMDLRLMARIFGDGDTFYMGHEGGFPAEEAVSVAERIEALPRVSFAGITSFPALLYDEATSSVKATPNLRTLEQTADALRQAGHEPVEINAPGTTSVEVLPILADAGATQVEPGHGLTGTTPLHAVRDLPEGPAVLYLSEVSHFHQGKAYCFGGGMYIDPVFTDYQVHALVGRDPEQAISDRIKATLPPPEAIDYYGLLDRPEHRPIATGDTVIFGFRIQAFVAQAFVVPVSGVRSQRPQVEGIFTSDGAPANWPA